MKEDVAVTPIELKFQVLNEAINVLNKFLIGAYTHPGFYLISKILGH